MTRYQMLLIIGAVFVPLGLAGLEVYARGGREMFRNLAWLSIGSAYGAVVLALIEYFRGLPW